MPRDEITATPESPGPLPFLQFTNGGIRVNFGGYHAEAGLGGLLRGTGPPGLHASAGTPWGAHAGAGLGGQLNGEDGNLGGGLYARAGLGRGRPEAAAGLGGRLDGRSFNPIAGGLYAGATPGGPGTGVYLGGGLGGAGMDGAAASIGSDEANANSRASGATTREANATADAAASVTKLTKGRTNIQIIRSRAQKEKDAQKEKEKVVAPVEAVALPADAPADGKAESQNKEIRRAVKVVAVPPEAEVGLVGSISLVGTAPVVKSVEKSIVPSAPVAPVVPVQETVAVNTITTVDKNPTVVVSKPVYPRWYFRKRFWTVPRKVVYAGPTADSQSSPSDIVGGLYANSVGDGGTVAVGKVYTSGSLFDDIFNIPISTLSAVNQLLNNVG
ncbi:uncharacterized protein [Polyergus mexicanus]